MPAVAEQCGGPSVRWRLAQHLLLWVVLGAGVLVGLGSSGATPAETSGALVLKLDGPAVVVRAGRPDSFFTNGTDLALAPGDQFRTLERSKAVVRLSPLRVVVLGEHSRIQIPDTSAWGNGVRLLRGILYYFHRGNPGELPVRTPLVDALVRGTEFSVAVAENGATRLDLIEGEVEMTNEFGRLTLKSGEAGRAEPGQRPVLAARIEAVNVIQWVLYYPGVIETGELELTTEEQQALTVSLAAYGQGDLLAALAQYPAGRQPKSDAERVYLAALLLGVGQVDQAEAALAGVAAASRSGSRPADLAGALRKLMAAVKFQTDPSPLNSQLATCWLAESYYQQSRASASGGTTNLAAALAAARQAVARSPRFGFGWARVAELEFSFGRTSQSREAVERALQLAPRHAQAVCLQGFLHAAQSHYGRATAAFEQAIALDGGLGNAWLGRGLCRIHHGDARAGLQDLEVAATVEPQRAVLRSYLGKAFSHAGEERRAEKELALAKRLDANDPTAWLYSALLLQQENRINEAIRDLEHSQELNDNRALFRSALLLDQDRAIRSANLAHIYRDAGMEDVSVREAVRAVNSDYANYSAHLFLAESYDALRDPRQINLRYETPWLSEYLVANLLAPAAAGAFSPYVTQQDYARLFERDHLGLSSSTEYSSRGDWFQTLSQYGLFGHTSYALNADYRSENGYRANEDLKQETLSLQWKQDITPADSLYLNVWAYRAESGDVNQYYDQKAPYTQGGPNTLLRMKETQEPMLLAGYHHEWSPGVHTLVLGGRLEDEFRVSNPQQSTLMLGKDQDGVVTDVLPIFVQQTYRSEAEIYTAELQQIWQQARHGATVGARFQTGQFDTSNQSKSNSFVFPFLFPKAPEHVTPDFQRASFYGYYRWQVVDPLLLVAGLSYDSLQYPENFRYAPLSPGQESKDQLSPKGGLIWTPARTTVVRAGYAQALSGVSFDQSFQLEPTEVAGFNQAFRSLIPESVAGANAGAPFATWGAAVEQRFGRGTYLGLSGVWLESDLQRTVGVYDFLPGFVVAASKTREQLDYTERTLNLTLNQLVGDEWSFGARYRLSQAELQDNFLNIPNKADVAFNSSFQPRSDRQSLLHQVSAFGLYQHRCGFFASVEAQWNAQNNQGYSPEEPGDAYWMFNAFAGYRFARRHVELTVGLLNLADRDYKLAPLNLTLEQPRARTLVVRFQFYF
jgi:predicted Zn-dependent protease